MYNLRYFYTRRVPNVGRGLLSLSLVCFSLNKPNSGCLTRARAPPCAHAVVTIRRTVMQPLPRTHGVYIFGIAPSLPTCPCYGAGGKEDSASVCVLALSNLGLTLPVPLAYAGAPPSSLVCIALTWTPVTSSPARHVVTASP